MNIDTEEFASLIALLGDEDTVVSQCVDFRLKSFGSAAVRQLLYRAASETDSSVKAVIAEKAEEINVDLRMEELRTFLKRPTGPLSLFDGGFIVCSLLDVNLQRETFEDLFFKCSAEYLAEASAQRTAYENIGVFNYIFFNRLGFTLYDIALKKPEYSLLSTVLRTRRGNPFALAYIYLMIAQVAGLPLKAVCFPGGFLPVYVDSDGKELFYVNVYKKGDIIVRENLLHTVKVTGLTLTPEHFKIRDGNTLLGIYVESLLFVNSRGGRSSRTSVLECALSAIGTERFLSMEEE